MPLTSQNYAKPFSTEVFKERFERIKERMGDRDIDVLLISQPTNQYYLSGYESESWYTFQMLVVIREKDEPIFVARNLEERAAKITTWMVDSNVRCYPEQYGPDAKNHPVEWIRQLLAEYGQESGVIGVEKAANFFTVEVYQRLQKALPGASLRDASNLVDELYLIKGEKELEYIREAGKLTDRAFETAEELIEPGMRENDAAAELLRVLVEGTEEYGGEEPAATLAFGPFHYRYSDISFEEGDLFSLELSGRVRKYHKPLCRVFHIGEPDRKTQQYYEELNEDLEVILDTVEPGLTGAEVDQIYREKANHPKKARSGYAAGLGVTTSWAEGTAGFSDGDDTVLQPGMTFHSNPSIDGIGPKDFRMLHSEYYVVTDDGCEVIGEYPRKLVVI
jgi:Xaa-Pro dipeptidase